MNEAEKTMMFMTVFVGSMMILSILVTFYAVPNLTPSFMVWIGIWFIILWRYPEARWWRKTGNKIKKLHWFSMVATAIAIICLEYVAFLVLVDCVFPFLQTIIDLLIEILNQTREPW